MRARIVSHAGLDPLVQEVVTVLEGLGFEVEIRTLERPVTDYVLRITRAVPRSRLRRFRQALRPLRLPSITIDSSLSGVDLELRLGGERPLSTVQVGFRSDSPALFERLRGQLDDLGFGPLGCVEWDLPGSNRIFYGGASVYARDVVRWVLERAGIKGVREKRAYSDADPRIVVAVRDPALADRPLSSRFPIEIVTDDRAAGDELGGRFEAAGYCCKFRRIDAEDSAEARFVFGTGPLTERWAAGLRREIVQITEAFLAEKRVDKARFPLEIVRGQPMPMPDPASPDPHAVIWMPLAACLGGRRPAYAGPFPERFEVTVASNEPDHPSAVALRASLGEAGYRVVAASFDDYPDRELELFGFHIFFGTACTEKSITRQIEKIVSEAMADTGADSRFELRTDPDLIDHIPKAESVLVLFPAQGHDVLYERMADPSRFAVRINTPNPGDYAHLAAKLARRGYECEVEKCRPADLSSATLRYGGAPPAVVEDLTGLVEGESGVDVTAKRDFGFFDTDILIGLPQPREGSSGGKVSFALTTDIDAEIERWLTGKREAPAEKLPLIAVDSETIRFADVTLRRRQPGRCDLVPRAGDFAHYCIDATTSLSLYHLVKSVQIGDPCLFEGATSTSKSSLVLFLASLLGQPVARVNFGPDSDTTEVIGRWIPGGVEEARFKFLEGWLPLALANGYWILLDEVNLAGEVVERINSVLDDPPSLVMTEHDNSVIGGSGRPVHPDFWIAATMNPSTYGGGRARLSPAMLNRWRAHQVVPHPTEGDYLAMLRQHVFGEAPDVRIGGRTFLGFPTRPLFPQLAEVEGIGEELLPAVAKFHAGVEAVARRDGAAGLGSHRREGYTVTRRNLLSAMRYVAGADGAPDRQAVEQLIRESIARYYLAGLESDDDRRVVLDLAFVSGLGHR